MGKHKYVVKYRGYISDGLKLPNLFSLKNYKFRLAIVTPCSITYSLSIFTKANKSIFLITISKLHCATIHSFIPKKTSHP